MTFMQKLATLIAATVIVWLFVGLVVLLDVHVIANVGAIIIGMLAAMTMWSMWALDQIGISVSDSPHEAQIAPPEKAKRETSEDARLSLLLSLLSPDERDALKTRLVDELEGDGEMVSLADLLADQEQPPASSGHA